MIFVYILLIALAAALLYLLVCFKIFKTIGKAIVWFFKWIVKIIRFTIFKIKNRKKKENISVQENKACDT